jgi:DNA invertase Pin-like site-specific DNA recombinase
MGTPVAYLRKSRVIDERTGVSWEVQEAKVRELAAVHGDNGSRLLILSDWNVSGRKGREKRPGYDRLLDMIESGQASAVYSYNMARLSRSTSDLLELVRRANARGVPIRLVADQFDTTTATGRMLLTVLAAVDEMTADLASEHAKDAVAARRARGDRIGHPFYGECAGEDAKALVRAYEQTGSVMRAARLLNQWKVPTRMGKPWATSSLRENLVRLGAMPHRARPGAKPRAPFVLYGLLRCHCGHLLTGTRYRNGKDPIYAAYKCYMSRTVPDHGLSAVPEKRMLAWVMEEAARLRPPDAIETEVGRQAERDKLEARRAVIADMYESNGPSWRGEYQRRMAAVKADEDRLEAQEAATAVLAVPDAIQWDVWPPERINAVLRAMWDHVELDEHMRPIRAEWLVPEWRAAK